MNRTDQFGPVTAALLERRSAILSVLEQSRFPREDWLAEGLERQFPSWNPAVTADRAMRAQDAEVQSLLNWAMERWRAEPDRYRHVALYDLLVIARHLPSRLPKKN